jgi:hypothetical protein
VLLVMVRGELVGVADPEEGRLIHWTSAKVPEAIDYCRALSKIHVFNRL